MGKELFHSDFSDERIVCVFLTCLASLLCYRKGCFVAAVQGGAEIFLQKINNAYQSLLITTFKLIVNPGGSVARHPVSNTVYVQPAHSCICISLNDIRGEIMLFPETGNNYAVVDPFRQKF